MTAKGFRLVRGRDHEKYFFYVGERKTQWQVQLSHGAAEINVHQISLNARGLQIKAAELFGILNCDLDGESTLRLFHTVYPVAENLGEGDAAAPPDTEQARLQRRLREIEEAMQAAAGLEDDTLQDLCNEWTSVSKALALLRDNEQ